MYIYIYIEYTWQESRPNNTSTSSTSTYEFRISYNKTVEVPRMLMNYAKYKTWELSWD